jgi:L-serine/L-threonine ammonia-lyase
MHVQTPLVQSLALGRHAAADVWLKFESAQPVGSFKIRGVGHACRHYAARGARGFVSSSGGNAGLAVAYAGRRLGLAVDVVVPVTTSRRAIDLIEQEGAKVRVHGANWNEAHELAIGLASPACPLIHPFDDPLLWEGHATLVDELAAAFDGAAPDLIVLSVGGGGLLCGVMRGLERNNWTGTRVVAVETEGAASLHAAIRAGRVVDIGAITSVAGSLGARQVTEQALKYGTRSSLAPVLVSDADAVGACMRFLDDHRTLVEPACGASLAPVYGAHPAVRNAGRVVVVVCGGVGITRGQLDDWKQRFGL